MSRALTGWFLLLLGATRAGATDLPALLDEALRNSPVLAAAGARAEAASHRPAQAGTGPDPIAKIGLINESLTHLTLGESPDSVLEFRWMQEVPYPGKLDLSAAAARADLEVARTQAGILRWELGSAVKQAWTELVRLEHTAEILDGSRDLLASFQQSARARYESGEGMLESVLKAQTELARLEGERLTLMQRQRDVELELMALLGRETPPVLVEHKNWPEVTGGQDVEDLVAWATEHAPRMQEINRMQEAALARADLARRNLKADFSWEAAYGNRGGLDPMFTAMAGFRLPIRKSRLQTEAVTQADFELEAALRERDGRRVEQVRAIRSAWSRQQRASDLAELTREAILPQARAAMEAASAAYRAGKVDFLTLLDSFLAKLRYEIDLETQTAERIIAFAQMEPLTARELVIPGGTHE